MRCLRLPGADWRPTSELAASVEALLQEEMTPELHHYVRLAVRRRLRNMLRAGSVERRWTGNINGTGTYPTRRSNSGSSTWRPGLTPHARTTRPRRRFWLRN